MSVSRTLSTDIAGSMISTPPFDVADASALEAFVRRGAARDFRAGTYLFHQGDDAAEVHFLYEGRLEISTISISGHRVLHTTLDRPQLFGELGPLAGRERSASVVALDDVRTWVTSSETFFSFLAEQPQVARGLLAALARQVMSQDALVDDLLFLDLKGRVAKRLLGLVSPSLDELPPDGAMLPSIVTHADLASLAGGSRENVTRILSDFRKRGLVSRDRRRYRLENVQGLAKIAGL